MPQAGQRRYGQGAPVPGFTWELVPGTAGSRWQLPQYELTPIPGQAGAAGSGGSTPSTTTGNTQFPTIPEFGLPDIAQITQAINQMTGDAFNAEADNRIPGQAELEAQSSAGIQQLLSPAEYFPGTSRTAAEEASGRGIPGSGAADSTWVRRTREEQLREMGLGQQFFNAAIARNPIAPQFDPSGLANYLAQLPGQRAQLLTQQQQFAQSQQQQRDLAIAQMENAYRLAQLQALRGGEALRGGGGGGGGYRGSGAGATTSTTTGGGTTPRPRPNPNPPNPDSGSWTAFNIPVEAVPENWNQLTYEQQAQYAAMIHANPYFGLPDYVNPYSNEYEGWVPPEPQAGGGGGPIPVGPDAPNIGFNGEDFFDPDFFYT